MECRNLSRGINGRNVRNNVGGFSASLHEDVIQCLLKSRIFEENSALHFFLSFFKEEIAVCVLRYSFLSSSLSSSFCWFSLTSSFACRRSCSGVWTCCEDSLGAWEPRTPSQRPALLTPKCSWFPHLSFPQRGFQVLPSRKKNQRGNKKYFDFFHKNVCERKEKNGLCLLGMIFCAEKEVF